MKEEIISNLDNPKKLEKLYRDDVRSFKQAFDSIYPDFKDTQIVQVWNERLNFENEEISWGNQYELLFIIVASFLAGLLAKIPDFLPVDADFFYSRNTAFIVFPLLIVYFTWRQKNQNKSIAITSVVLLLSCFYINFLPNNKESDTLVLACIHLPLFLWTVLGFSFVGNNRKDYRRWLDFLRYNGDVVVMSTIILIAGIVLTMITFGLFGLTGLRIEEFYMRYIVVWGIAASPIVGTYLVQTNPQLVNKVSPVIAKVFTPLVLVTLIAYLLAAIGTGKDPYSDREFLLVFNILLIAVMAIILFSIVVTSKRAGSNVGLFLLLSLAIITVIVNGTALSAILYRISEWGFSPNRLAVFGSNILVLAHLLVLTYGLFKTIRDRSQIEFVEKSIAYYLPIYGLWTIFVTFIFPLLFHFQ